MKIEHIAIYTKDLEELREFYEKYFNAKSSEKYRNPKTQFESYFFSFEIGKIIIKKRRINDVNVPNSPK